jgi:hypothetical protein
MILRRDPIFGVGIWCWYLVLVFGVDTSSLVFHM